MLDYKVRFTYFISIISFLFLLSSGCSTHPEVSNPGYSFHLGSDGEVENSFYLDFDPGKDDSYLVAFVYDQSNVSSKIAPHRKVKVNSPKRFDFELYENSDLDMTLQIYSLDGFLIYSHEYIYPNSTSGLVELPVMNISRPVTNVQNVEILVSTARSKFITQLYVEGDVTDEYNGKWHDINVLSKVPIKLTSGAGVKNLTIKVRDSFNVESSTTNMVATLDVDAPANCDVELASENVGVALVNFRMRGVDQNGPVHSNMYFSVSGDLAEIYSDIPFEDGQDFWIKVGSREGIKRLSVAIFDEAGNQCVIERFSVNYDREWAPFGIELVENKNYTDEVNVEVAIRVDAFDKSNYQILVEGNLQDDLDWMPYSETVRLTLESGGGIRHILLRIKEENSISNILSVNTYLNPELLLKDDSGGKYLELPNLLSAAYITTSGCINNFVNVEFDRIFPCEPSPGIEEIVVDVEFNDGEILSLATSL
jgi:hypothetical protein